MRSQSRVHARVVPQGLWALRRCCCGGRPSVRRRLAPALAHACSTTHAQAPASSALLTLHCPPPPPAAEAPGRRLQAMPDAYGRAACRDRGPRRHGRGHARQLVPEPPCAAGVGCAAAAGELIEHALHVLQGGRGQRRRRRRSSNEVAAVACAFELCLNGRFGAAMLGRGARCCAEDRDCESRR